MANTTSSISYLTEDLATFLAKSVSDGTYADIVQTLKTDQVGEEAAATQIAIAAGQLWSNVEDDFFLASYPLIRQVATGLFSLDAGFTFSSNGVSPTVVEAEFKVGTQSSEFTGSELRRRTRGTQTTDATIKTLMTLHTLDTNSRHVKISVDVSGQDTTNGIMSDRIVQTFYRDNAGVILAVAPNVASAKKFFNAGAVFSIALTISGDDILLRVTGAIATVVEWMAHTSVQEGGMSA